MRDPPGPQCKQKQHSDLCMTSTHAYKCVFVLLLSAKELFLCEVACSIRGLSTRVLATAFQYPHLTRSVIVIKVTVHLSTVQLMVAGSRELQL